MSHTGNTFHPLARRHAASVILALATLTAPSFAAAPTPVKTSGITEHKFASFNAPPKQLGESCSARGKDGCLVGEVCLKTTKVRGSGHYCTKTCTTEQDCPANWLCREVIPGPGTGGRLCVPPGNWSAAIAQVRPDGGAP